MKYKNKDFQTILNAFCRLSDDFSNKEKVNTDSLRTLCDYPVDVLEEFLNAMSAVKPEQVENSPQAVAVYVLMRMNMVEMTRKPLDY